MCMHTYFPKNFSLNCIWMIFTLATSWHIVEIRRENASVCTERTVSENDAKMCTKVREWDRETLGDRGVETRESVLS